MNSDDQVFISYAREDQSWAERLYMDLRTRDINVWLDVRCLAAGANWKFEIKNAIRRSRHFILLVSKHSINKRGFVQKEMKEAIEVLDEFPTGTDYLIPARLDLTEPIDDELRDLNWVDLLPDYHDGLARILSSLKVANSAPLIVASAATAATAPMTFIDKGEEITVEVPLILGQRAAVSYAPFRSRTEFLRQFFDRLPRDSILSDKSVSFYVTLDTRHAGALVGEDLKQKYPEYITLVIQNAFHELSVLTDGFSVVLAFNGVRRNVGIAYDAIRQIEVPELGISISLTNSSERPQS